MQFDFCLLPDDELVFSFILIVLNFCFDISKLHVGGVVDSVKRLKLLLNIIDVFASLDIDCWVPLEGLLSSSRLVLEAIDLLFQVFDVGLMLVDPVGIIILFRFDSNNFF